ncbi:MAG: hypothetical protein IID51_06565 [Proteobacteria bacterium]|nr:hypothetical protein [Pseudomonadota bacterium]
MATDNPQEALIGKAAALHAGGDSAGALDILFAGHKGYPWAWRTDPRAPVNTHFD